jgi:hypothetical protein
MLLAIDRLQAFQLIGSPRLIREDRVVPGEFPDCPDSPYKPGYDWLFRYERQIAAFLEKWLRPYRYELIGQKGILCEALSNAFAHGHKKDPELPIFVRVFLGGKGLLVQIENDKRGFDVEEVYSRYRKRRHYYLRAGNGIRLMAESHNFGIFHDTKGKTFHLLYLFDCQLDQLPPDMIFAPHGNDQKSTRYRPFQKPIS